MKQVVTDLRSLVFSFGVDVWTMLSFSILRNALVTEELSQHVCPIENYVF